VLAMKESEEPDKSGDYKIVIRSGTSPKQHGNSKIKGQK
jgi:hypothetical protein